MFSTVGLMSISPYIRGLRDKVGNDLLLLPSAAVLPRDDVGRLLLVRLADTGNWGVIGGGVEPDESPQECAVREAREEAGVELELGPLAGVFGGPEYRVAYPNGDETSYVVSAFEATILSGEPRADGSETTEVGWFDLDRLPLEGMGPLNRALLRDLGLGTARTRQPVLVVVTGLQGTGKSTIARVAADHLGVAVLSHDWAMSGLRPYPEVQATLDNMDPPGHGAVGWSLLIALARSQLRAGKSVVLDGMARAPEMDLLRRMADDEHAALVAIMTECSDPDLHRTRVEGRNRGIPNWYELDWSHVEKSRANWDASLPVDLRLDTAPQLEQMKNQIRGLLANQGRR